ncbi:cadmium-translocating P-type ATPase [Bacillus sp. NTK071]|uniref:Cd(2+)-exporting ATPase n=1 Tax=Guptibacillus hwajinpoensis TaxID=208199 RepID=A0A4U1MB52_9BACL|nr:MULTISPECIES: cation-translocating P-type ATPase [Bacillaceae]MBN8211012.1 cadmium-translocating P-type ATPase [Bacillus sp. NTK071]TKD67495.1 cadmium-translocating P-type ATPase [Pseudalkalibacillus hwajinpoensis]
MEEYRLKGLSCPNCAAGMEQQINKLDYGETARIQYNSGKLKLDERVNLDQVEKILASDHASLIKEEDEPGHAHDHNHDHSKIKLYLGISTGIFILALLLDGMSTVPAVPFYLAAIILSGYQTFIKGLRNLTKLTFNIETLMTIALIGAVSIGEWKEGTLVAILFGLNEYLEGLGMEKARKSMESLLKIAPKEALLLQNGTEKIVSINELKVDDLVLVKSGAKIPSDGVVESGNSSVNESAITGEAMPVEKGTGESVFGGSINNEGILRVRITKAYEDSSLSKILHLVEEAQETKTPTELFINRFSRYYTPVIMLISALVMLVPPVFLDGAWENWFYQGLAVLIVGCPCALILSSPIANISGITRNARNGILVKGSVYLEQLGKIDTLAFDKTGTLTKGKPYVEKYEMFDREKFLAISAAVERHSSHPLAKAIMDKVNDFSFPEKEASGVETVSGQGVIAEIDGEKYWVGNEKSVAHVSIPSNIQTIIEAMKQDGLTLVIVADAKNILGVFGISDEVREESASVINDLHASGIKHTVMLTGDHEQTAEKVAGRVGVRSYFAGLLPEEKVEKVKQLTREGKVAMIGDGINDAPALASADLGIAMGKGTDSAIETADIVLMQDHLGKLPEAITIAKRVNRTIRLNIVLALGLKLIALLLTIPGLLTLWIAILSDMGATILVTVISLTILWDKKKETNPKVKTQTEPQHS